jgi:hypothetical protein
MHELEHGLRCLYGTLLHQLNRVQTHPASRVQERSPEAVDEQRHVHYALYHMPGHMYLLLQYAHCVLCAVKHCAQTRTLCTR